MTAIDFFIIQIVVYLTELYCKTIVCQLRIRAGVFPAHARLLELLPVLFNPLHCKVHKLSLFHKPYGCIA